MARGWESKSVEDQQAESIRNSGSQKPELSDQERRKQLERRRLQLARTSVSNQVKQAQNPRYVQLLMNELSELDRRLSELD